MSSGRKSAAAKAPLRVVAREWTRIGVTGFGGPPAHIALLRLLVVDRYEWMDARAFEDANAACGLLPGPASTQLAIFCAYRVAGPWGAIVGGLGFVVPAVVMILALSVVFLGSSPPKWVIGAGAGAGAAVAPVAVRAALGLLSPSLRRARAVHGLTPRWLAYVLVAAVAAATIGGYLVLVLLACGALELVWRRHVPATLSFDLGLLVVVALGQVTPGPVVATVAAVGYAAHGIAGGVVAAIVAFAPSFSFILLGGERFERLRQNDSARAFLDGAGPAAIGAILGAAIPLMSALREDWQYLVLAAAAVVLLVLRRGVVQTLLGAGAVGVAAALAGAPLPH